MKKSKPNLVKFTAGIFFALQIIGATVIFSCPSPAEAADDIKFSPQVTIPNSNFTNDTSSTITGSTIASYIGAIYNYGLAIAGILATIVLMAAGVIWLTSGGDSGKVSQAKELISGSVAGLIILIVSWVILNTVNPDLVNLKSISPTNIIKKNVNTSPQTCNEATNSSDCVRLGFCYWQNNKCITKAESGAILCSINKNDIKETFPQCCCEQVNYKYTNCKWSVGGGTTYCASSCGSNYVSVNDSYCQ